MVRGLIVGTVSIGFLCALSVAAPAEPPANADPALAPWFQAQKVPGTSASCCDVSDGRAVEYRIVADHYEVYLTKDTFPWIEQEGWKAVDPQSILVGQENPTGRAIAWVAKREYRFLHRIFPRGTIMCFKPPNEV
jgi:hypothetical protein